MDITHEYVLGITELCGDFYITHIKDGSYIFKFIIYHDDIQLLYAIKKIFRSGRVINNINSKFFILNSDINTVIKFFTKHKLKTKNVRLKYERWVYLYTNLIQHPENLKNEKCKKRVLRRLKYFGVRLDDIYIPPDEEYRTHPILKNLKISNYGNIFNTTRNKFETQNERSGYYRIKYDKKYYPVHRLVLETFTNIIDKSLLVRHYPDPNHSNNKLWNLLYGSYDENVSDSFEQDLMSNKLLKDDIINIKKRLISGDSVTAIAKDYCVSPSIISRIKNGNIWKNIGDDISNLYSMRKSTPNIKLTYDLYPEIKELYDSGITIIEIAKRYNVSKSALYQFLKVFK